MEKILNFSDYRATGRALQSRIEDPILTGYEAVAPDDAFDASLTKDARPLNDPPETSNNAAKFFSDRESFDAFEREILPQLFADKSRDTPLRVWCVGCATGEEAYSIGMALLEYAATIPIPSQIRIFGTDIDEESIMTARNGSYPIIIQADVPPLRLRRFFTRETEGYRIINDVRKHIVFATHDLLNTPPISKLDLLVCRRGMADLNCETREWILKLFHFALRSGGFLFLGDSAVTGAADLFTASDEKHRIYRANNVPRSVPPIRHVNHANRGAGNDWDVSGRFQSRLFNESRKAPRSACSGCVAPGQGEPQEVKQRDVGESCGFRTTPAENNLSYLRQVAEPCDLADLINLAYDAIIVRNVADRILFWNWGAERLYGWPAEEVIGHNATELLQTTFPKPMEEIRRDLLLNKRWEGELNQFRRDGSRVTVASRWALQCGSNGQFKILQVNRDITKRKEVEEDRVRLLHRLVQSQEKERQRLSRELHDHFGQQLTALRIGLEALRNPNWELRQLSELIDELQTLAKRLDADVGFMAWDLRPSALDNLGLVSAITAFTHEWSKHFGTPADFQSSSMADHRFSPEIETNLYRIAQEALNNVSKHARASRVDVILERRNNQLALIIEDDGIGFDPQQGVDQNQACKGLGLVGMRERALLIGGRMEIESSSGAGTTVYIRVPLEPPND